MTEYLITGPEKITNLIKLLTLFCILISSCSTVPPLVSLVGNAGISSRGITSSVEDSYMKTKIVAKLSTLNLSNLKDITVSVCLGSILLTGYADDQTNRLKIVESVWEIEGIKKVYNEMKVDSSVTISERTEDFIFESKLTARLLFKSGVNSNNYSIDVVGGDVYVIGLAPNLEEKTTLEEFLESMKDIPKLVTIIMLEETEKRN